MPLKDKKSFNIYSPKGCLGIFLMVFLVLFGAISITLARTGMVNIPVLSKALYKETKPTREIVLPSREVETLGQQDLSSFLQKNNISKNSLPDMVTITEQEATFFLNTALSQNQENENFKVKKAQLVFLDSKVEIYADLEKPINSPIVALVEPVITKDSIDIKIDEFKLGSFSVPSFLINKVIGDILDQKIDQLQNEVSSLPFKYIKISQGILEVGLNR